MFPKISPTHLRFHTLSEKQTSLLVCCKGQQSDLLQLHVFCVTLTHTQ